MSESDGDPLQSVKVEYDEDETVEVKYEPLDSELESKSEILRYDCRCRNCQKFIMKITAHLTGNLCPIVNDGMGGYGEPEAPEYIIDESSPIKTEPEDYFVKLEPRDDNNDPKVPGTHDSVNSRQKQHKVCDFDTGLCKPRCEFCVEFVQEFKYHLERIHPHLPSLVSDLIDVGPDSTNDPLPKQSTVGGPLKTVVCTNTSHFRQIGKTVDGTYILKVVLTPDMEKQNRLDDMSRKTRTSRRAGYVEESIATHPGSSKPVKKKSRPNSDRNDQKKNEEIKPKPRTRVPGGENFDWESKSKESESEGRSSNEIGKEVESSKLNLISGVTLGENAKSSDSHEINLTDHVSYVGLESQDITQTGDDLTEMSKTTVEGVSVQMIHGGEELDNTTHTLVKSRKLTVTGQKSGVIIYGGGESTKMNRVGGGSGNMTLTAGKLDEMSHTEELTEELASIVVEPGRTTQTGTLDQLSRDMVIPSGERESVPCHCVFCETSFKQSTALGTLHTCDECGEGFETFKWLTTHKRIHMENYALGCDFSTCTIRFKTQSDFITHSTTCGGEKLFRCDVCGMRYKYLAKLIAHLVTHGGENPFGCEICGEGFKTLTQLDTHILGIHRDRKYQLTDHKVIHSEKARDYIFMCYICEKSYKVEWKLIRHIGNHGELKPYNCEVEGCEMSFKSSDAVINHMLIHTKERPFKCETCQRNFKTSQQLTNHIMRCHSEWNRYNCLVCEMGFKSSDAVINHMLIHTKERPFKCDICERTFRTSEHLSNHIIGFHSEWKGFKCNICKRTFTRLSMLRIHKSKHDGFQ